MKYKAVSSVMLMVAGNILITVALSLTLGREQGFIYSLLVFGAQSYFMGIVLWLEIVREDRGKQGL